MTYGEMKNMNKRDILEGICKQFVLEGEIQEVDSYGNGHINDTYRVTTPQKRYILQRMNRNIFHNTSELMENIVGVTKHLQKKIQERHGDPQRETLNVIPTIQGMNYYTDEEGYGWRVYQFIEGASTYDLVKKPEDFYATGIAFGNFQSLLADYPADTLHETIQNFHNTPSRYETFMKAIQEDKMGRVKDVEKEIVFLKERKEDMMVCQALLEQKELPLRVTHNDTKLNNIMIDDETGKAICVIDLDTVMPGLSIFDFGDSIRFGASTAEEDERDLSKVSCSMELFECYTKGFLAGCQGRLTAKEIEMLPMGAKVMTLECGMRFLTDYLQGDTYFKIHRPNHNLDRCRTQLALVADMEKKWDEMKKITKKYV